jgi:hypothetical protein
MTRSALAGAEQAIGKFGKRVVFQFSADLTITPLLAGNAVHGVTGRDLENDFRYLRWIAWP